MNADDIRVEISHKQELIAIHKGNLHALEVQAAKYGIAIPLDIHNNMELAKSAIKSLQNEIKELNSTINDTQILSVNMSRIISNPPKKRVQVSLLDNVSNVPQNKRKITKVLSDIVIHLEHINGQMINAAHIIFGIKTQIPKGIWQALSILPVSSRITEMNRSYNEFMMFYNKNRLYVPEDVHNLMNVYRKVFFPNATFRYIGIDIPDEQLLSEQIQTFMGNIIMTMRKYIE